MASMDLASSADRSTRPVPMLAIESLSVHYNRSMKALDELSLVVGKGEIVGMLGPNGAGKTTTLRAISGFLPGDRAQIARGAITFDGQDITDLAPYRCSRRGIAMIAERDKIFASLTIDENLRLGARANPDQRDAARLRENILDSYPILRARLKQTAGYLSGGERQMLAIGSALLSRPSMLLIDELSLGLSPLIVQSLIKELRRINMEEKMTMLLVEQSASVVMEVAQHIYILNNGRVVKEGPAAAFKDSDRLRKTYLGIGEDA